MLTGRGCQAQARLPLRSIRRRHGRLRRGLRLRTPSSLAVTSPSCHLSIQHHHPHRTVTRPHLISPSKHSLLPLAKVNTSPIPRQLTTQPEQQQGHPAHQSSILVNPPSSAHFPLQARPTPQHTTFVATTVVDMVGLTSAAGLVGFLSEPDPSLQSFALHRLNADIDLLWPEVSASIGQM